MQLSRRKKWRKKINCNTINYVFGFRKSRRDKQWSEEVVHRKTIVMKIIIIKKYDYSIVCLRVWGWLALKIGVITLGFMYKVVCVWCCNRSRNNVMDTKLTHNSTQQDVFNFCVDATCLSHKEVFRKLELVSVVWIAFVNRIVI